MAAENFFKDPKSSKDERHVTSVNITTGLREFVEDNGIILSVFLRGKLEEQREKMRLDGTLKERLENEDN